MSYIYLQELLAFSPTICQGFGEVLEEALEDLEEVLGEISLLHTNALTALPFRRLPARGVRTAHYPPPLQV